MDQSYINERLTTLGRSEPGQDHGEEVAPGRRNPGMIDTSARTAKLDQLKVQRDQELAAIRQDRDITSEARAERLREAITRYQAELNQEARRIRETLDAEAEQLFKQQHPVSKPGDATEEMFRTRLHQEVTDELLAGRDPIEAYKLALRLGDREKARTIEQVAPGWIEDHSQRAEFARLVEQNQPKAVRAAKEKQAHLKAERRQLEFGLAMQGIDWH